MNSNSTFSGISGLGVPSIVSETGTVMVSAVGTLVLSVRADSYSPPMASAVPDGKILINGEPTEYYTFKMDYYWMMGDNRDRSLDSRYWGFVPEDHLVGSPMFIITSLDEEKSLFNGKFRWNRTFANPNPDKSRFSKP